MKVLENLFYKIIDENVPGLARDLDIWIQKAQHSPGRYNVERISPWHIIISLPKLKNKEHLLKTEREKCLITYKENFIRQTMGFSAETWDDIFKVLNLQPEMLYAPKFSFINGKIKSFPYKHIIREFVITKTTIQEMLKGVLNLGTKEQYLPSWNDDKIHIMMKYT